MVKKRCKDCDQHRYNMFLVCHVCCGVPGEPRMIELDWWHPPVPNWCPLEDAPAKEARREKMLRIEECWACEGHKYTNSEGYRSLKCMVTCIQISCGPPGTGPLPGKIPDWCELEDAPEAAPKAVPA